jgi:hypothetical protein
MTNLGEVLSNINQGVKATLVAFSKAILGCCLMNAHHIWVEGYILLLKPAIRATGWMLGGRLEASEPSDRTLYITSHERLEAPGHSSLVPSHHAASCQAGLRAVRGE